MREDSPVLKCRPGWRTRGWSPGVADVIAAVQFAHNHNLEVAVHATRHNVAGLSVCNDGMMIDLSAMKGIHVSPAARAARVEPGVTWEELNHELQTFGLAATGGYVGITGVAGLTLGGDLGWMVRKHGCALDNLLSADVVTADGQFLTVSASTNADLSRAFEAEAATSGSSRLSSFQVDPAGTVLAGLALHAASKGREVLRFWRGFESTASDDMTNGALI